MRRPQPTKATTTAGASVVIYDSKKQFAVSMPTLESYTHVRTSMQLDQATTFLVKWAPERDADDSALVTINGAAQTGETAAANSFFARTVELYPGRIQISVTMGTPAPTANKIAWEFNTFPGLIA